MSAQFISLEDAAKKLGVSTDELVEMRSRGDIFGYRDGASWKFKPEEIERVASEMMGGALDEDPAGSSILISGADLGLGSAIGSDLKIDSDPDSDVQLVANAKSGSDVSLAPKSAPISDDDDDELSLQSSEDELLESSGLGSDIKFATSDESAIKIGSGTGAGSGSDIPLSGSSLDLELSDQDLVLGPGSDLALGNDSGINLMSPSDSGISLEDEPLDLAASGISGLDLAAEGSDAAGASAAGSGLGSSVDFQKDEEFQLSASGSLETDEDSGSQVIELEDSSDFGDAAVALPAADGFEAFGEADPNAGMELGAALGGAAASSARIPVAAELPYTTPQIILLLGILLLMCTSGMLVSDIVRNLWASEGASGMTSGFTSAILSAIGK